MWFTLLLSLCFANPGATDAPSNELGGVPGAAAVDPDAPVTEALVSEWTVPAYNAYLVAEDYEAVVALYMSLSDTLRDPNDPQNQGFLDALEKMLTDARARALTVPPYKGDTGLREAVVASYDVMLGELNRTRNEFLPLLTSVPLTNEHILKLEESMAASRKVNANRASDLRAGQVAFAERNGAKMAAEVPASEGILGLKPFVVDGLPPRNSSLPADIWVVMANNYLAGCIQIHNTIVAQQNGVVKAAEQGGSAAEEARLAALAEFEAVGLAIGVMGDFQGDHQILDALKAELALSVSLFENEIAAMAAVQAKGGPQTQEDVDAYNGAMLRMTNDLSPLFVAVQAEQDGFQKRWHFEAYKAFRAKRSAEIDAKAATLKQ